MKSRKEKQNQRNYDCVICFDLCKKPISCRRCHQLLCNHHVRLLSNKCPHCRLEPFQFSAEPMIESYIQIQQNKIRQEIKKDNTFKCLVEGCVFEGKYSSMVFHRKAKHPYEKIQEILFQEERQKKKMRDAIKKIFLQKFIDRAKKYNEQALTVYVRIRGQVQIKKLTALVAHIDNCKNQNCKQILNTNEAVFIGRTQHQEVIQTQCVLGKQLKQLI